jgi:hypothetical protein
MRAAMERQNATPAPVRLVRLAPPTPETTPNRANRTNRTRGECEIGEALAERAAVIEEGAHVPRPWAEAFARLELTRPPRQALDTAGRALDAWGVQAARLGWRPDELLEWAMGGEVLAVTAEGVTLLTAAGVTYRPRHQAGERER